MLAQTGEQLRGLLAADPRKGAAWQEQIMNRQVPDFAGLVITAGLLTAGGCVPFFDFFDPAVPGEGPFVASSDGDGGSGSGGGNRGSSGDDAGGGGGSTEYALTSFADPHDPLVLRAEGSDGSTWEFYGQKDSDGNAVGRDRIVVRAAPPTGATGSELHIWLDPLGRPVLVENAAAAGAVPADLLAAFFNWDQPTTPDVDVFQAGQAASSFSLTVPELIGPPVPASSPPASDQARLAVTVEVRRCGQVISEPAEVRQLVVDPRRDGPGVRRIASGSASVFLADVEVHPNAVGEPQTQESGPRDRLDGDALCWPMRRVAEALGRACDNGQTRGPCSVRGAIGRFIAAGCTFDVACGEASSGQSLPAGTLRLSANVSASGGALYRSATFSVPEGTGSASIVVDLSDPLRAVEPADCGGMSGP